MKKSNWTKNELILAFNLYLRLPFGKMHSRNKEIIYLANLINRSPGAVAMRLTNFAHIDPFHQARGVKGLAGGAKQCQPIWDEFEQDREVLIFSSEQILAKLENKTLEEKYPDLLENLSDLKGTTKLRETKTRINQQYFRLLVLSNYVSTCAISGIDIPKLLIASHIIPWSKNEKERLNPENGICLSPLYDKAFDKGLIGISTNYHVIISNKLAKNSGKSYYRSFFSQIKGIKINHPEKYIPKKDFLEYHLDVIFEKD